MTAMDEDCTLDRRNSREELLADCRLRAATDLFTHTWDPVVLAGLRTGPRRRADLLEAVGGLSDKVLTETLRRLLANGLVERHSYRAAPPRVEYRLSPLGTSLVDGPMRELGRWTLEHGDELLDAQERAAVDGRSAQGSTDRGSVAELAQDAREVGAVGGAEPIEDPFGLGAAR